MPERWLQIKGDPAMRGQLFQQQRVESLYDTNIDRAHEIVQALLTRKGVFHTKIHYSSSQLTSWFACDPFCYEKCVHEEILGEFRRLCLTDVTVHLRNGAINLINGMINMTLSCDGTHYIDHQIFLAKLDRFETPDRSG